MIHFLITPGPETGLTGRDHVSVFHVTVDSEMTWGGGLAGTGRVQKGASMRVPVCVPSLNLSLARSRGGAVCLGLLPCPSLPSPSPPRSFFLQLHLSTVSLPRAVFHSCQHLCGVEMSTTIKV